MIARTSKQTENEASRDLHEAAAQAWTELCQLGADGIDIPALMYDLAWEKTERAQSMFSSYPVEDARRGGGDELAMVLAHGKAIRRLNKEIVAEAAQKRARGFNQTFLIRPQIGDLSKLAEIFDDNHISRDSVSMVERKDHSAAFLAVTLSPKEAVGFAKLLKDRGLKVSYQ